MQRPMMRSRLALSIALTLVVPGCPTRNPQDDSGLRDAPVTTDASDGGALDAPALTDSPSDVPIVDDAPTDASFDAPMADSCAQLAAVRSAASGAVSLPVQGVVVTYVRPALGGDPAGFFVQCAPTGPAAFVAIDPATLTPTPSVGDRIAFTATMVDDAAGTAATGDQDRVLGLADLAVEASGVSLTPFVQDLSSSTDVVTGLDGYESELLEITGTIEEDFVSAGTGYRRARFVTAGVDDPGLVLRLPETVIADLGLRVGCEVTVGPSPLWRFDAVAQVMGYESADVTVLSCPAIPSVAAGAVVITELGFTFAGSDDGLEHIELFNPSPTATVELAGCVLTDAGTSVLTLRALSVAPRAYAVIAGMGSEITAAAVLPETFGLGADDAVTLTCGTTVVDTVDWGAAPFPAGTDDVSMQLTPTASTASANDDGANWCLTPTGTTYGTMGRRGSPGVANPACPVIAAGADVQINELNAHIAGGCDLVELRVISGGSMAGYQLQERGAAFFTFPEGFTAATNAIIVVHADRADPTCTGGGAAPLDETTAANAVPSATVSTNYDTAFDFYATDDGITDTDNVLAIVDATSTILDAVLVADDPTGTAAGGSESAAAVVAAAGEWTTEAGTVPAGGFVDDAFCMNAALDLNATGTTAAGTSIQRNADTDTNDRGDWSQLPSTFGAANVGQTAR